MICKINIKIGQVEVNYEGEEAFFREEFPKMLSEISDLSKKIDVPVIPPICDPIIPPNPINTGKKLDLSVETIAARIKQKTGPELILAAAAYLKFVEKIDSFSRDQLWEKMKTATSLNKESYGKNLSVHIKGLVSSQQLIRNSSGNYALSIDSVKKLESLIV
jgi:hypothetical protein